MNDTLDNFKFSGEAFKTQNTIKSHEISKTNKAENVSFDDSSFFDNLNDLTGLTCTKNNIKDIFCEGSKTLHERRTSKDSGVFNCSIIKEISLHEARSSSSTNTSLSKSVLSTENELICPSTEITIIDESPLCTPEELGINTFKNGQSQTDINLLSSWNLPESVVEQYRKRNITKMFDWQVECLQRKGILENNANLLYSAPTSAGKTLVSEILAMKCLFERKKKVLFILPFISVAREKLFYFQDILGGSDVRVEGFMGTHSPPGGFQSINFAVGTIEKCNGLVNRLLEDGKLADIGMVIIDELHLLGDPSRGYLLELLLTKLKYVMLKNEEVKIQIVGMSATLPNLQLIAYWLNAELYTTDFRPIPLQEQIHVNNEIYNSDFTMQRSVKQLPDLGTDTDNILQLCLETIRDQCSVLIFCSTKNWCENLSQQIAEAFWKVGRSKSDLGQLLRTSLNVEKIMETLEQLKYCPAGLDKVLKKSVSFGVAYHHAGLTMEEREIIEGGFKGGSIRVLVATSTLSSGVNLPARRVIIRTPVFNGRPLDVLTYRQMIGRAGRMGIDSAGESILICQKYDINIGKELVSTSLKPVESCLEDVGKYKRAILEIIASEVASTPEDLHLFANCTLLSRELLETPQETEFNPVAEVVDFLKKFAFIRFQSVDSKEKFVPTSLGKACLSSSMPPNEGLDLFTELERARQCFVLETELHLIYLVTPYSACYQWSNLDWMFYLGLWEKLPLSMKRVGDLVGVKESFIVGATRGKLPAGSHKLLVHKRFFVALALQDLVNEKPLDEVAVKFSCNRGMLQSLQQSAATFAGMVTAFSKQLGWSSVELLISQFQDRLQFGVSRDLLELMRLPILNAMRARALYNAGLETLIQLANSDVYTIENILHKVLPFESKNERDGETNYDVQRRNNIRNVWITGRAGMTEQEAAEMILADARKFLEMEMGIAKIDWENKIIESSKTEDLPLDSSMNNSQKRHDLKPDLQSDLKLNVSTRDSDAKQNISTSNETKNTSSLVEKPTKEKCTDPLRVFTEIRQSDENVQKNVQNKIENSPRKTLETKAIMKKENMTIPLKKSKNKENLQNTTNQFSRLTSETIKTPKKSVQLIDQDQFSNTRKTSQTIEIEETSDDSMFDDSFSDLLKKEDYTIELTSPTASPRTNQTFRALTPSSLNASNLSILSDNDLFSESLNEAIERVSQLSVDANSANNKRLNESTSSEHTFKKKPKLGGNTPTKNISLDMSGDLFEPDVESKEETSRDLSKFDIVDVCSTKELFNSFCAEAVNYKTIALAVACSKIKQQQQPTIGFTSNKQKSLQSTSDQGFSYENLEINGLALSFDGSVVFYLSLNNDSINTDSKINLIKQILGNNEAHFRIFDSKEQILILKRGCGLDFGGKVEDPKILDWLLDPDGNEKSLCSMIQTFCPEAKGLGKLVESCKGQESLGLQTDSSINTRIRASIEVIVTWNLYNAIKMELIHVDNCFSKISDVEMESLLCVTKMEITGMSVDKKYMENLISKIKTISSEIEKLIYSKVGRKFSLTSHRECAKILGISGKKVSTKRQVLEKITNPISDLILLWRKLSGTLAKMIDPLKGMVKNNRIHGSHIIHHSTGRITMHDPNLQNVAKDFEFQHPKSKANIKISCRSMFVPENNYVMLSADYCQLELRILSHLAQDELLCNIMRKEGDIFKSIAAKWNNISENKVTDEIRQRCKQLCYAIIYGMGSKALAEQLNVEVDQASSFMDNFKNTYPRIKTYTSEVINFCKNNGYVKTFAGRRRYLRHIGDDNPHIRSQAERQAVNTTVQGSAADIVKRAMIAIEKALHTNFMHSLEKPRLVLFLHDELIYEVPKKHLNNVARTIKDCMEKAVCLSIPLPVKLKVGPSWGDLKEVNNL